jgi:uncharacterized small protein (DUF1192 family)
MKQEKTFGEIAISTLRMGTPVLLSILGYLILAFQNTLIDNTRALNELRIQIAVIARDIEGLKADNIIVKRDISILFHSVSKVEERISVVENEIENQK